MSNILNNNRLIINDIHEEIKRDKANLWKQMEFRAKPSLNSQFNPSRVAYMNVVEVDSKGKEFMMSILVQHMLLKKFGSKIRHIVAYTKHFPGLAVLDLYGIEQLHVGQDGAEIQRLIVNCGKCRYPDFGKIAAFNLWDKFDKIVVLDVDIMPVRNLDHMFSYPGPFAASFEPDSFEFNTGVFILEPSKELWEDVMDKLKFRQRELEGFNFSVDTWGPSNGDQSFLTSYFF